MPPRLHPGLRLLQFSAAGVLLYLLLVPSAPVGGDRVFKAWWDFLHMPAFAAITFLFTRWIPRSMRGRKATTVALLLLSVPAVECIQQAVGREFALTDMVHGWAGVLSVSLCTGTGGRTVRFARCLLAILVAGVSLGLPVRTMQDRAIMRRAYPVLAGFDTRWVPSRWFVNGLEIRETGEGWMAIHDGSRAYPGLFLADVPADWRRVEAVLIDVELSTASPDALVYWRMDDRPGDPPYHDRFEQSVPVKAGRHTIRIGRADFSHTNGGRPVELGGIQAAGMFFTGLNAGDRVILHRIEVELTAGSAR